LVVKSLGRGLVLYILRYADELREPSHYFEGITTEPDPQAVKLAAQLIEHERARFEPEKMPNQYAIAIREMIHAKIENRALEVVVESEGKPETVVVNIMAALKKSMEAKGRTKVRARCGSGWESSWKRKLGRVLHGPTKHSSHGALARPSRGASGDVRQWPREEWLRRSR
jgi:non-homologous end joining protein Ku